jgi:hypothetical protein
MATQSGDDVKPPTALARLHLEDGSTLTGRSFGCHESVSGEVSFVHMSCASQLLYWVIIIFRLTSDTVSMIALLVGCVYYWYGWLSRGVN